MLGGWLPPLTASWLAPALVRCSSTSLARGACHGVGMRVRVRVRVRGRGRELTLTLISLPWPRAASGGSERRGY